MRENEEPSGLLVQEFDGQNAIRSTTVVSVAE